MMRSIIESSIKLKFLILIIALGILYLGYTQLRNMSKSVLPEFGEPHIEIQTEALGLSAVEVEELITTPMEADLLNGIAWVKTIYSSSIPSLSSIILIFDSGTDLNQARQMVQERLTQAHALPNVSKPPTMLQPSSSTSRVMMIGMSSEELSLIDMSVLARWNVVPRLMGVQGVSNVAIFGQRKRQLQVQVDPEELNANGIGLQQIISTSGNALWVSPLTYLNASTPGTGGWIDTPNQRLGIRHLSPITTAEDLAQVSIDGAQNLRLGDVATIVEDNQPLIGDALINHEPGLLLVVEKLPGADTLRVSQGVKDALAALAPGMTGITFDENIYEPGNYINEASSNLQRLSLISGIVLLVILWLFLFDWRSGLIGLISLPLSFITALLVLYYRGANINFMVIAGLALALMAVTDDIVIGLEQISLRLRENNLNSERKALAQVILEATLENRRPMLFATLILLAAIIPVLVVPGLAGSLLKPLALTYALAIVASFAVALLVIPALSVLLYSLGASPKTNASKSASHLNTPVSPLAKGLQNSYVKAFHEKPVPAFIVAALVVVGGLLVIPQIRKATLIPELKVKTLVVDWVAEPGTSQVAMSETLSAVTRELESLPGVTKVTAQIGRGISSDIVSNVHSSQLWVSLDPTAPYQDTISAVEQVVAAYPAFSQSISTYFQNKVESAQGANSKELTVRVYGDDLELLKSKADEMSQALVGVKGITSAEVEHLVEQPLIQIEVDLARADKYGIKPGDVRRAAATLISGVEVGSLFEDQKVFGVVVWGKPDIRSSIESVSNLLIDTPSGDLVKIGDLADVRTTSTPVAIQRESVSRYLDVIASVEGRNLQAVAKAVQAELKTVSFPIEFHAELLGYYAERLANQRNLLGFIIGAIIIIFLLLQSVFRSWSLATVALASIATVMASGLVIAGLSGTIYTLTIWAGLVAVLGIAARQIIGQISHYQVLEQTNDFGSDLVLKGTHDRLLPIMSSSLALSLALLPFIFSGKIAGLEFIHPLAILMLGGIISSALLSIFVLPALYLRFRVEPEAEFDFNSVEPWLPSVGATHATD